VKASQASSPGRSFTADDILVAATEEFATSGYRGTNLNNVADRLGVTRQALYYYYPRKHDMLQAIMSTYFDGLEGKVDEASASTDDPAERFMQMLRAHFEWIAAQPTRTAVFMQEGINLPLADRDSIMQRRVRHQKKFVTAYRAAVEAGAFAPLPEGLMVSILLGAANWSYRWFNVNGKLTPARYADFATKLLRDGFRMDQGQVNR
jgi:AcrR family transcriptional regulator